MIEPSLPDKVLAIGRAFEEAGLVHAFGGALALSFHAEPRTTVDIDVNVFVDPASHGRVDEALLRLGIESPADPEILARDGWFRYQWGRNPIDVFFSELPLHEAMAKARQVVPFGGERIWIISAEHLTVCKALFDRAKDWLDIEQVVIGTFDFDTAEVMRWIGEFDDPQGQRAEKLREIFGPGTT